MDWDSSVDVVCAGSGAGGLSAAIVSADAGLEVLVAEKDDVVGGVTALSSGQLWMGANSLARDLGIDDTEAATLEYLEGLSQGLADAALREIYVRDGRRALDYFIASVGIPLRMVRGMPDYYHQVLPGSKAEGRYLEVEPFAAAELGEWAPRCRTSPYGVIYSYLASSEMIAMQTGAGQGIETVLLGHLERDERCAGAGLAAYLLKAALDRGVEITTESALQRLVLDGERVVGAVVGTPDGPRRIRARRGVVLATGGYDWNADLLRHHEALPDAASMCPPSITGDHFALAADAGAIPVPARAPIHTPTFVGYPVPGELVYGQPSTRMVIPGNPHSILVNEHGRRFADDSFYPDVVAKVGRFDGQGDGLANWPACWSSTATSMKSIRCCRPSRDSPSRMGWPSRQTISRFWPTRSESIRRDCGTPSTGSTVSARRAWTRISGAAPTAGAG